jgi:phage tail-like protein
MDTLLLPAFRFEVSLIRAARIVAGAQRLVGLTDAPSSRADEGGDAAGEGYPQALGNGGFQECTGLEFEMDMQDYQEGGRNNGVIRRAGRAKFPLLVLKRGMFYDAEPASAGNKAYGELWGWIQSVVNGVRPIGRYDGIVYVKSADNTVRATWMFERGLPAKVKGPDLNAKTGEIAIEELHIAHEGLRLMPPRSGAA